MWWEAAIVAAAVLGAFAFAARAAWRGLTGGGGCSCPARRPAPAAPLRRAQRR